MIADSPYDFSGLILKPLTGAIVGILGAGGMLAVVAVCEPLSGLSVARMLSQITLAVLPAPLETACGGCDPIVGLSAHLLVEVAVREFQAANDDIGMVIGDGFVIDKEDHNYWFSERHPP